MRSERDPGARAAGRLHPFSLAFSVGQAARRLLLPGLAILFFASRGSNVEVWLALLFVPTALLAAVRYFTFRYRLGQEDLVIREGLVIRNERHIPYARIQNVDLVQNPVHRLLRVAEVRLETAGGDKPEAVLRVLSLQAADELRARVFADRQTAGAGLPLAEPSEPPERLLHRLGLWNVLLCGLLSSKGMLVVGAVAGALLQSGLFEERLDGLWRSSRDVLRRAVPLAERPAFAVVVALGGVLLLVLAARVLSVAWALYTLWGFRLTRRGDDLRAEHGLLTRVSKTIPRHRIQVLTTREGLLHQLLGRAAVQVQTAGGAEGEEASPGRLWLAPLIRAERVDDIVREAFPDVDMAAAPWQSVSPRARTRLLRATIGLLLPLIATGAYLLGGWVVPLAALALAVAATQIGLVVRRTAWALAPGTVLFRSGFWVRRTSLARFSKIQSVVLSESPFDRRHRMASVQIDTAGAGGLGHSIAVSLLDAPVARGLEERLFREAAQADFRW